PSERDGNVGLYQGFYIFTFKDLFEDCQHCKLSHADVGGNVGAAQRRAGCMSRPTRIPDRGDIPLNAVASLMGLSLAEFQQLLPDLTRRGFPPPAIQGPSGNVTSYRKLNKPAFGPLGDSLDDLP